MRIIKKIYLCLFSGEDTADVGVEKMRNGDHGRENIREGGVGDVKRKTGESKPWERRVCLPIYFNLFSSLINNY